SSLALNPASRPWIRGTSTPRRAGVNAFGFAGINAHAILEEHPSSADGVTAGAMLGWPSEAILIAAEDRAGLVEKGRRLADRLRGRSDVDLKDLAYTLALECVGWGDGIGDRPPTLPSPTRGEGEIPISGSEKQHTLPSCGGGQGGGYLGGTVRLGLVAES